MGESGKSKVSAENRNQTHVKRLTGKQDDLVELREISQEVVHSRPFGSLPSVLALDRVSAFMSRHKSGIQHLRPKSRKLAFPRDR